MELINYLLVSPKTIIFTVMLSAFFFAGLEVIVKDTFKRKK